MVDFLRKFEEEETPLWEDERESFPIGKKRKVFKLISGFLVFVILAGYIFTLNDEQSRAATGINKSINFQGKLTDTNSVTVADGTQSIVFRIYDAATGGSCLYSARGTCGVPTAKSITVTNGIFSTLIGESGDNDLSAVDFNSDSLFMGVTISSDAEMTPRIRLGSTAYAFNTDTLDGLDSGSFLRSDTADTAFGLITFNATPTGTSVGTGSLYVNATTTTSNLTLLGIAANGSERFRVDMEGDVFASSTIYAGAINTATTTATSTFSGPVAVQGNLRIGDASTDLVDVTARFTTSLLPSVNNAVNFGGFGNAWGSIFASGTFRIGAASTVITIDPANILGPLITSAGALNLTSVTDINITPTGVVALSTTGSSDTPLVVTGRIRTTNGLNASGTSYFSHTVPGIHNAFDLGSPTSSWRDIYASGTIYSAGGITSSAGTTTLNNLAVTGNTRLGDSSADLIDITGRFSTSLLPNINNFLDLGAFGNAWRDIYASGTIRVGSTVTIHSDQIIIQESSAQTSSTFQITNRTGAPLFWVSPTGGIGASGTIMTDRQFLQVATSSGYINNLFQANISTGAPVFWVSPSGGIGSSGTIKVGDSSTSSTISGTTTSTFVNGLQLINGCFRLPDGSCAISNTTGAFANTALSNLASVAINTSLLPGVNNSIDLGAFGNAWRDIFASGTLRASSTLLLDGTSVGPSHSFAAEQGTGLYRSSANVLGFAVGGTQELLLSQTTFTVNSSLLSTGADIRPSTDNAVDLGSLALRFRTADIITLRSTTLNASGTSYLSHTVPAANNSYDLGSPTSSWRDIYASGTIYSSGGITSTSGTSTFTNLAVTGNTRLGDSSADLIDITGRFSTSLLPNINNSLDLGAFGNAWRDVYASGTVWVGGTSKLATDQLSIQQTSGQTSSTFRISNSSGAVLNWINPAGGFGASGTVRTDGLIVSRGTGGTNTFAGDLAVNTTDFTVTTSTGRVGIGTANPRDPFKLTISGTNHVAYVRSGVNQIFGNNIDNIGNDIYTMFYNDHSTSRLGYIYSVDNSPTTNPEFVIWNDGRVGVGSSTPFSQLSVVSGNAATSTLAIMGATSQTANLFQALNGSGNIVSWINASGGIGASGTSFLSHVVPADNNAYDLGSPTSSWRNIYASGTVFSSGTSSITVGTFADGSAAAPSITFTNDTDTGFYRPGANAVGMTTNGVLRAQVDADAFYMINSFPLVSQVNNGSDLGAFDRAWNDIFASGTLRVGSTVTITGGQGTTPAIEFSSSGTFRSTPTDAAGNAAFEFNTTAALATANLLSIRENGVTSFRINSSGVPILSRDQSTTESLLFFNEAGDAFIHNNNGNMRVQAPSGGQTDFLIGGTVIFRAQIEGTQKRFSIGTSTTFGAALSIDVNDSTGKGIVLRQVPSQAANLFEWQDQSGVILGYINPSGGIGASGTSQFSHLVPAINNSYDLGSPTSSWRNIYASGTISIGGTLLIPDGSAAAPSIAFKDDQDTGIYSSTNGSVALSSDGVILAEFRNDNRWLFYDLNGTLIGIFGEETSDNTMRIQGSNGRRVGIIGSESNSATAIQAIIGGASEFSTVGAKILSLRNAGSTAEEAFFGAGASNPRLVLQGRTSQSGNFLETRTGGTATNTVAWINASGSIGASGTLYVGGGTDGVSTSTIVGPLDVGVAETPVGTGYQFGVFNNDDASLILRNTAANVEFAMTVGSGSGNVGSMTNHDFCLLTGGSQRACLDTTGNFYPATANTYDLGRSTFPWKDFYASGTSRLGHTVPGGNNAFDLGSPTSSWRNIYASGTISSAGSGTSTISGNLEVLGNTRLGDATTDLIQVTGRFSTSLLPNINNSLDLGAFGNAWRDIYASGTIRVGSTVTVQSDQISIQGSSGQTSSTFRITDRAGTPVFWINPSGSFGASSTLILSTSTISVPRNMFEIFSNDPSPSPALSRFWVNSSGTVGASSTLYLTTPSGSNSNPTIDFSGSGTFRANSVTSPFRAFTFDTTSVFSGAASRLLSIKNGGSEVSYFDTSGGMFAASSTITGSLNVNGSTTSTLNRILIGPRPTAAPGHRIEIKGDAADVLGLGFYSFSSENRPTLMLDSNSVSGGSAQNTISIGTSTHFGATVNIEPYTVARAGIVVRQMSGKTGTSDDLLRIEDASGDRMFSVSATGTVYISNGDGDATSTSAFMHRLVPGNNGVSQIGGSLFVDDDVIIEGSLDFTSTTGTINTNVNITGNLRVTGECQETDGSCADVAEIYPASEPVEIGEIVVLDINGTPPTVKKSITPYSQTIVGVVSGNPGLTIGESEGVYLGGNVAGNPLKPAIALTGRVPVKVSTENGEIQPGDYLTSSSQPGIAMKATQAGTVIGRALESFDGEGEEDNQILVFVHTSWFGGVALSEAEGSNGMPMNRASETSLSGSATLTELNMEGDINMNGHLIRNIGGLVALGDIWKVDENGNFITKGTFATEVETEDGKSKKFYALGSPDVEFHISGSGQLQNGEAMITFESETSLSISPEIPLKVTVTLTDNANGVFVTEKTTNGFKVKELANGNSNATFDWVVIARRKGYEVLGENKGLAEGSASSTTDSQLGTLNSQNIDGGGGTGVDGGGGGEPVDGGSSSPPIDGGSALEELAETDSPPVEESSESVAASSEELPSEEPAPEEESAPLTPGG